MLQGDVVDELHDNHSLAHTSTTEQANLPSLCIRRQQVYHFDARQQLLGGRVHLGECRSRTMDGIELVRLDRPELVNRFADDIDDTTESLLSNRDLDGGTSILHFLASGEAISA